MMVAEKPKPPASQRVLAPSCPYCKSDRTGVYCTRRPIRYCKCERCGHTWSHAVVDPRPEGAK